MNIGKIRIYSLSVNICKKIFEEDLFEILDFKENEDATAFDIEIGKVKKITFEPGILIIKSTNNDRIYIESDEYKEIIIP